MSEPFTHSEHYDLAVAGFTYALDAGLAVVKSETADVKTYQYKYATLLDVLAVIDKALAMKGCHLSQVPSGSPDGVTWTLTTMIVHQSGQWIAFAPYTRVQVRDEQGFGSALTYARRYSLLAIFGISPSDDDGAEATKVQRDEKQFDGNRTAAELSIRTILGTLPTPDAKAVVADFKTQFKKALTDLPPARHVEALTWVVDRIAHLPDPSESSPASDESAPDAGKPSGAD